MAAPLKFRAGSAGGIEPGLIDGAAAGGLQPPGIGRAIEGIGSGPLAVWLAGLWLVDGTGGFAQV